MSVRDRLSRRQRLTLLLIVLIGALLRLSTFGRVFSGGRVFIDEPDGYYHLRRAALSLEHWPLVPQFDPFLNAPAGGRISWPPLFDGLLATLALPWRGDPARALEVIGAFTPAILGVVQLLVMFGLVRTLSTTRAALIAAAATAVLPASVRYTLLGTLDHDPFYELMVLVSIWLVAAELRAHRGRHAILLAAALAAAILGWAGALILPGILGSVVLLLAISRDEHAPDAAALVAAASAIAAVAISPFVAASTWTHVERATFEGLSLLHETALVLVALASAVIALASGARRRLLVVAVASTIAATFLVPVSAAALIAGVRYAAGDAAILQGVSEAQPLLFLFGRFDLTPLLIRLTIVPAVAMIALPWMIAKRHSVAASAVILGWLAPVFVLALAHSRFSYSAALATCAAAGLLLDRLLVHYDVRRAAVVTALVAAPILAAYVPIPGYEPYNFYTRSNQLRDLGMDGILDRMKRRPDGVVFAPWSFGHWIIWTSQKPVVQSPMLTVGQSQFARASRLYFETDPAAAMKTIDEFDIRYFIVTAQPQNLGALAAAAGADASPFVVVDDRGGRRIDLPRYLRTVPGHLALRGPEGFAAFGNTYPPLSRFREIDRSEAHVGGPLGRVPFVRVYEVIRPGNSAD